MSTPDPAHIDAVARAIYDGAGVVPNMIAEQEAKRVLTSTDPAVHAAMLDALTRHGVLTKAEAPVSRDMAGWYPRWDGNHEAEGHRLVTSWEVTP